MLNIGNQITKCIEEDFEEFENKTLQEKSKEDIFDILYDFFLSKECVSIDSYSSIEEWIEWFCNDYEIGKED